MARKPIGESTLTAERLREVIEYDPEWGMFTAKADRGQRVAKHDLLGRVANSEGYVYICVDAILYRANRLAWLYMTGEWPKGEADHKNQDREDNRWDNLRDTGHVENPAQPVGPQQEQEAEPLRRSQAKR